jgi:hypothetical protein
MQLDRVRALVVRVFMLRNRALMNNDGDLILSIRSTGFPRYSW